MTILFELRRRHARQPGAGEEQPDADGDEVEDADEIVDGRVVRPLLVVVVEAVELRQRAPRAEGSATKSTKSSMTSRRSSPSVERSERESRRRRTRREADDVGGEQHPAHEPAAAAPAPRVRGECADRAVARRTAKT